MPLPNKHLDRLDRDLRSHETRLSELAESVRIQQDEMRVHETVLKLGRDPSVKRALAEIFDSPQMVSSIRTKTADHFKQRGVPLPPDADVRVVGEGADMVIEAELKHGRYRFKVMWSPKNGFGVESLQSVENKVPETMPFDSSGEKEK